MSGSFRSFSERENNNGAVAIDISLPCSEYFCPLITALLSMIVSDFAVF
jgi:hypothetical protein